MSNRSSSVPAGVIVANAAAVATLIPIVLHQVGALDHLPDPPSAAFDSDGITESKAAHPFGIPDGILGVTNFSATVALALVARRCPRARTLLAVKLAGDTAFASFNVVRQVVQFRKLCSWCTATALCTFASAAAGVPLIREELRKL